MYIVNLQLNLSTVPQTILMSLLLMIRHTLQNPSPILNVSINQSMIPVRNLSLNLDIGALRHHPQPNQSVRVNLLRIPIHLLLKMTIYTSNIHSMRDRTLYR